MSRVEGSAELMFAQHLCQRTFEEDSGVLYASKDRVLHVWVGAHWKPLPVEEVESLAWGYLRENFPEKATPRVASSCAVAALHECMHLPEISLKNVVLPLRNATLELVESESISETILVTRKASRDDGLTYVLNCSYDETKTCKEFDKFLLEVLPDEDVRNYVQEYIGYTLLPDCRYQRAQFWLGGGANGKSTLAEIVGALHDKPAAMQLDQLDGFNLIGLLGASLVYVDETPTRINEQKLKALISGGLVQIDRKYREPLSWRSTAKWIVCGNSLPSISDQTEGFWRRFPVIPFNAHFPDSKQDPLLAKRIINTELAGILNWSLTGLIRLLNRGRFGELPLAVAMAINSGKQETNSVLGWWMSNDYHKVDDSACVEKDEIYGDYHEWCKKMAYHPLLLLNFGKGCVMLLAR